MKRYLQLTALASILAFMFSGLLLAQDKEPVYPPFETVTLIDNQTTFQPYKGSFNLEIQHRFSQIKDIKDIYGIYGSANTRIGADYAITDKIMVGLGTTRSFMQQDLQWKYLIISQKESGGSPLTLSYFGNAVLDARADKYFGPEDEYNFMYRFSYTTQLIASRKFGEKVGIQMAPSFVYFNAVPEGYRNDNYSLDVGARFQILGLSSIILEYDQPLVQPQDKVNTAGDLIEGKTIYPNLAFGVEIGTSTHSFRVFVSNYNAIVKNRSVAFNDRNPWDGDFQFGFNISIRF